MTHQHKLARAGKTAVIAALMSGSSLVWAQALGWGLGRQVTALAIGCTFGGGLSTVQGVGAGVEPATDDLSGRCSTRLSYPVVATSESNREPAPI